jgi:conjugative transfer signal peptidase TraF
MLALVMILLSSMAAKAAGWRINVSGSLPEVLYRVSDRPAVGDYMQFCSPIPVASLPDGGSCPGGKLPLIKRVVATAGDRIDVDAHGVRIDGVQLPDSAPKRHGRDGTQLPSATGEWVLDSKQVWVAGEHPDSFDSRYFGPIDAQSGV